MQSTITIDLERLRLKVRDLGDAWYKVSIYYTNFDPYQLIVNFGYGNFDADMLKEPILVLYNTEEDLVNGEKYQILVCIVPARGQSGRTSKPEKRDPWGLQEKQSDQICQNRNDRRKCGNSFFGGQRRRLGERSYPCTSGRIPEKSSEELSGDGTGIWLFTGCRFSWTYPSEHREMPESTEYGKNDLSKPFCIIN